MEEGEVSCQIISSGYIRVVSIPFPHLYLLLSFCLYISIFCIIIYDAGRLFFMLRRFPIESKGRRKKLHEVGSSLHCKSMGSHL